MNIEKESSEPGSTCNGKNVGKSLLASLVEMAWVPPMEVGCSPPLVHGAAPPFNLGSAPPLEVGSAHVMH